MTVDAIERRLGKTIMKPCLLLSFIFGVILAWVPFIGGCVESSQATPEPTVTTSSDEDAVMVAEEPANTDGGAAIENAFDAETALVTEVENVKEKPLPPNVRPKGPVAEVIRLAESGVDQSVMLAFVTNSTSTFNLGPEEIIYLNDIGIPSPVVTAMIQRDHTLADFSTTTNPVVTQQTAPSNALPPPEEVAPQPAETAAAYPPEPPPGEMVSDGGFYDSLAPYGNWVNVGGYGWCWQPTVVTINPYWQPYFDCGRWVYSNCGWYWCSDYSWGWAPFHYGRWFNHHSMGWCWTPDHVWGPSWVSWRYTDSYCGWAPLPPGASFTFGVGLTFHGHHVKDHDDCGLRPNHYRFVAWNHFHDSELASHRLSSQEANRFFDRATVATRVSGDGHTVVNHGLPPTRVAAATHTPVHTVTLRDASTAPSRAGRAERFENNNRTLQVYRPQMPTTTATGSPRNGSRAWAPVNTSQPHANVATRPQTAFVEPKFEPSNPAVARIAPPHDARPPEPQRPQQNAPLILRGSDSPNRNESVPPSSMVIIGRKDANGRPAPPLSLSGPATTTTSPLRPATRQDPPATAPSIPQNGGSAYTPVNQNWQRNTPWLGMQNSQNSQSSPRFNNNSAPVSRPEVPRYQSPARVTAPEAPKYSPGPAYMPQRSVSTPAPSQAPTMQSRPAPPAPSAPPARSAPAPSSPSPSSPSPSGRNTR